MTAGCYIPGTPIAVDIWHRRVEQRKLYFLSHMHSDHTSGLSSSWNTTIYCSEITKSLAIFKFNIDPSLFIVLPIGQSTIINMDDKGNENLSVIPFDANHCAGAVMFLFEGYFGRILYTADFRFTESMLNIQALKSNITDLYLDNTYCDPGFEFNSKSQATLAVLDIIRCHPDHDIVFGLDSLGKEDLLYKVGLVLGTKVVVDEFRLQAARLLGAAFSEVFTTDTEASHVRVVKSHLVKQELVAQWNSERPTIVILPTCRYSGNSYSPNKGSNIIIVTYSDHCSFSELKQFVAIIKPQRVYPIVKKPCSIDGKKRPLDPKEVFRGLLSTEPITLVQIPKSVVEFMHKTTNLKQPKIGQKRKMSSYFGKRGKKASGIVFSSEENNVCENDHNSVSVATENELTQDITEEDEVLNLTAPVISDNNVSRNQSVFNSDNANNAILQKQENEQNTTRTCHSQQQTNGLIITEPCHGDVINQEQQGTIITAPEISSEPSQKQNNNHIATNTSQCQNEGQKTATADIAHQISKKRNEAHKTVRTAPRQKSQKQNDCIPKNILPNRNCNEQQTNTIADVASSKNSGKQNKNYIRAPDISDQSFQEQDVNTTQDSEHSDEHSEHQATKYPDRQDSMLTDEESIIFDKAPFSLAIISEERNGVENSCKVSQESISSESISQKKCCDPENEPDVICPLDEKIPDKTVAIPEKNKMDCKRKEKPTVQPRNIIEKMLASAYERLIKTRLHQNKEHGKGSHSPERKGNNTAGKKDEEIINTFLVKLERNRKRSHPSSSDELDNEEVSSASLNQNVKSTVASSKSRADESDSHNSDKSLVNRPLLRPKRHCLTKSHGLMEDKSSEESLTTEITEEQILESDFDTFDEELLKNAIEKPKRPPPCEQASTEEDVVNESTPTRPDLDDEIPDSDDEIIFERLKTLLSPTRKCESTDESFVNEGPSTASNTISNLDIVIESPEDKDILEAVNALYVVQQNFQLPEGDSESEEECLAELKRKLNSSRTSPKTTSEEHGTDSVTDNNKDDSPLIKQNSITPRKVYTFRSSQDKKEPAKCDPLPVQTSPNRRHQQNIPSKPSPVKSYSLRPRLLKCKVEIQDEITVELEDIPLASLRCLRKQRSKKNEAQKPEIGINDSDKELLAEASIAGEKATQVNSFDSTEEEMFNHEMVAQNSDKEQIEGQEENPNKEHEEIQVDKEIVKKQEREQGHCEVKNSREGMAEQQSDVEMVEDVVEGKKPQEEHVERSKEETAKQQADEEMDEGEKPEEGQTESSKEETAKQQADEEMDEGEGTVEGQTHSSKEETAKQQADKEEKPEEGQTESCKDETAKQQADEEEKPEEGQTESSKDETAKQQADEEMVEGEKPEEEHVESSKEETAKQQADEEMDEGEKPQEEHVERSKEETAKQQADEEMDEGEKPEEEETEKAEGEVVEEKKKADQAEVINISNVTTHIREHCVSCLTTPDIPCPYELLFTVLNEINKSDG